MRPEELLYASRLIRRKARSLARKVEFADVDHSDIEHDLLVDVLERWPSYDPARAKSTTFIARIVEHGIASMIRRKRAAKRDARKRVGLPDERDVTANVLDGIKARQRRGIAAQGALEELPLRLDLIATTSDLPKERQLLCALLKHHSLAEISRMTGRPRTSLYTDVTGIRQHFEDAGLRDYL